MTDAIKEAIDAFEELLNYIENKPVFDKMSDAGCGYIDTYRSDKFDELISRAKKAIGDLKNNS